MAIVACPTSPPQEPSPCRCAAWRALPFPYNLDVQSRIFPSVLFDDTVRPRLEGLAQTLTVLAYACQHADWEAKDVALPLEHAARELHLLVHLLTLPTRLDPPREECA